MAKKEVGIYTFQLCTIILYTICLLGLAWQITQISINYFAFDVVSDIKIIMPEEIHGTKSLNLFFPIYEVKNETIFEKIWKKYFPNHSISVSNEIEIIRDTFTLEDLLDIAISPTKLFKNITNETIVSICGRLIGYHIPNILFNSRTYLNQKYLLNVSFAFLTVGGTFPDIDIHRFLPATELGDTDRRISISIESHSYFVTKLSFPYVDDCINYSKFGFRNQDDAIIKCVRNISTLYGFMTRNDSSFLQSRSLMRTDSAKEHLRGCDLKYHKGDCMKESIFTIIHQYMQPRVNKTNTELIRIDDIDNLIELYMEKGNEPSFKVESKPRINLIDFITYILGAMGSWLGFSFIACNPIPYFLKVNIEATSKIKSKPDQSTLIHHYACARFRSIISNHNDRLKRVEHFLSRLKID